MTRRVKTWGFVLATLLILMVTCAAALVWGRDAIDPAALDRLARDSGGAARVTLHRATGVARRVDLEAGHLRLVGRHPAERAADFLRRYGRVFGVGDPATELSAPRQRTDRLGMTHLTYRQLYRGLPVFAGELRAHFDAAGRLALVHGTFIPDIDLDITPTRTPSAATALAVAHVLALRDAAPAAPLRARSTTLMVFRAGLARRVAGRNHLVFEVEVGNGAGVREFVYVDAHTGKVVDRISGIRDALDRRVYQPEFNNLLIWSEGDPLPYDTGNPADDSQINGLIDYAQDVYDFFANLSGGSFLSWDAADATLHSVFDIIPTPSVPCPNAFWDGTATNFCDGVTGDDTVVHEWVHAYSETTHDLIYQWQSGALSESFSDIFGETVDLLNGAGSDAPAPVRIDRKCSTLGGSPAPLLDVNSPSAIARNYPATGAAFNPAPPLTVTGDLELVNDGTLAVNDGCEPLIGFTPGRIALIDRGTCAFPTKVLNAQNGGAIAVVFANNVDDPLFTMAGSNIGITIPSMLTTRVVGDLIKAQLGSGVNATLTLDVASDVSLRWLQGEDDLASPTGGAYRDMWTPTCFAHPGKVSDSQFYACGTLDAGGVHTNSGVPNHAFALLVDGGTYNGRTVAALGLARAAHIYWRAMQVYQVPDTDFADHADAIEQSCLDLIGASLPDPLTGAPSGDVITVGDCAAVAEAMLAVEMRDPPVSCGYDPLLDPDAPPPACTIPLYYDDFDTYPALAWTLSNSGVYAEYTPRDWVWTANAPAGATGKTAFATDSDLIGDCIPGSDDQSRTMRIDSSPILISGLTPVVTFDHYVATEPTWDGGNLKISVNGGAFTQVGPNGAQFNGYNQRLETAGHGNTNPLAGQWAYTGANEGEHQGSWGQSQWSLATYTDPGDTIRLRFEFGADGCDGLDGWYVDNVQVCTNCGGSEVNDGLDNQCAGEPGYGLVDELSGDIGFPNLADPTGLSWTPQGGATLYQVVRTTSSPDFSAGCTAFTTDTPVLVDPDVPPLNGMFSYLVRPLLPTAGSWGADSVDAERTGICGL